MHDDCDSPRMRRLREDQLALRRTLAIRDAFAECSVITATRSTKNKLHLLGSIPAMLEGALKMLRGNLGATIALLALESISS